MEGSSDSIQLVRGGGLNWRVRADIAVEQIRTVLENPDMFLARQELQFKDTRSVTVVRVPGLAPGLPNLVLRRLNYGKLLHRLRDWFRPGRARRAFSTGLRLGRAGVATPRPVAVAEKRRLGWPFNAYLITEEIPEARTLARFLAENSSPSAQTVRSLADLLARLHESGFSHRDLKATNVLLDHTRQPYLIDLDGVRFHGRVLEDRAVADIARLARGLEEHRSRLRVSGWKFLRQYCSRRGGLDTRRFGRRISNASRE